MLEAYAHRVSPGRTVYEVTETAPVAESAFSGVTIAKTPKAIPTASRVAVTLPRSVNLICCDVLAGCD
jgi:hypothetical protein